MAAGSPQQVWLRNELTTNRYTCTLAYWHRPRWSSGPNFPNKDVDPLWQTLYDFGVDVVFRARTQPYGLRRGTMRAGDDIVWDQCHILQSGTYSGSYTANGEAREIDGWIVGRLADGTPGALVLP